MALALVNIGISKGMNGETKWGQRRRKHPIDCDIERLNGKKKWVFSFIKMVRLVFFNLEI